MTATYSAQRFCVAPMMDWTDRHCRYFLRLLSRHTLLYTEMITAIALQHGDRDYLLGFDPAEQPVALQLGGADPQLLAQACQYAEAAGYVEVNLNLGCPSDRVQAGRFGACLMAEPSLVAECIAAMKSACALPITIKTRTGIDQDQGTERLYPLLQQVVAMGCDTVILHARNAWLQGLSPKENREIPPLQYPLVYQVKQDFPQLNLIINGGIRSLDAAAEHLQHCDGVMLGREAYHNPYLLAAVDQRFFDATAPVLSRDQIVERLLPYIASECERGLGLTHITRHILGLFQGQPGARAWRRHLSSHAHRAGAGVAVVEAAWDLVRQAQLTA